MVNIQVLGVSKVIANLTAQKKSIQLKAAKAIKDSGFYVEGQVKDSIAGKKAEPKSVDTGRFLNSVQTKSPKPLVASVESDVEYGQVLEYGGTNRPARKHFANTAAREKDKVSQFINNKIKSVI